MGNEDTIRDCARKVYDYQVQVNELERRLKGQGNKTNEWWKGETGDTFRDVCQIEQKKIIALKNDIIELQKSIIQLAEEVRRAEAEREKERK